MNLKISFVATIGRILMSSIFLMSGFGKLVNPEGTKAYIASAGLPWPDLAYVVAIVIELGLGAALVLGYRTRIVAFVMAVFTLAAALGFHSNFADPKQLINFMKNIAIIGGFLQIIAIGAGSVSLDALIASRKASCKREALQ